MSFRTVWSSAFVGVLVSCSFVAAQWSIEARGDATYQMQGDLTSVTVYERPQDSAPGDRVDAAAALKDRLRERSASLIVASMGDGRPEMLVYDPGKHVGWLPPLRDRSSSVYLFAHTYSEERWSSERATPLLPEGASVEGVLPPPSDAGDLQYVRPLASALPAGHYVFSSTDSNLVSEVRPLLRQAGLDVQGSMRLPLHAALTRDPLVGVTAALLGLGLACTSVYWWDTLSDRRGKLAIHRRHGATGRQLVSRTFSAEWGRLAVGSVLGVALSGVATMAVGRTMLEPAHYLSLMWAGAAAVTLASCLWLACAVGAVALMGRRSRHA